MYIMRLDDASEYMDNMLWNKIFDLLDKYNIKPIVGIIPDNKDPDMLSKYKKNLNFWNDVYLWDKKGYTIAMHGYQHLFETNNFGINPINNYSEFAGLHLDKQEIKIENGYKIMLHNGVKPHVFFAPAHTFDKITLLAIKNKTDIKIKSDTIANYYYYSKDDFWFIPQQSGKVRNIKFKLTTFSYHPNNMLEKDYIELESFLHSNFTKFVSIDEIKLTKRNLSLYDQLLKKIYFIRRRIKK